jgi:hypothetical protein
MLPGVRESGRCAAATMQSDTDRSVDLVLELLALTIRRCLEVHD